MTSFEIARWGVNLKEAEERDDLSSAWQECVAKGEVWGGRAKGGRGVRLTNGFIRDVSVDDVNISFAGNDLLVNSKLRFQFGHRYGILGSNGAGKSTLLRRIARGSIPGFPVHLHVEYVQQEIPVVENISVQDYIFAHGESSAGNRLEALMEEEAELAEQLANGTAESEEAVSERMVQISEELERLEKNQNSDVRELSPKEREILLGLGIITAKKTVKLLAKFSDLSGGWRMRASLAKSLINLEHTDILLLDEATNHLDLHCIAWLESFLVTSSPTVVFVSHDRDFINNVATDIVEMTNQKLVYFPGTYEAYLANQDQMAASHERRLDAQTRKEEHVKKSIDAAKAKGNDQAAKTKVKKLERAAMTKRMDGKKFQLFSLKKLSEDFVKFPEKMEAIRNNRTLRFRFPDADIQRLRLSTPESPVLTLDRCSVGWLVPDDVVDTTVGAARRTKREVVVIGDVTLQVTMKSRVAIVGRNGEGKSTLINALIRAIAGEILDPVELSKSLPPKALKKSGGLTVVKPAGSLPSPPSGNVAAKTKLSSSTTTSAGARPVSQHHDREDSGNADEDNDDMESTVFIRGAASSNHGVRLGVVSQNHIDSLSHFLMETPITYLTSLVSGDGSAQSVAMHPVTGKAWTETDFRSHLGMFGLSGGTALQCIGSLSGGQKARLAFAASCLQHPHILLLDEPTNHLSIEALEALAVACRDFNGAVLAASHNRHFLSLVCSELWIVEKGTLRVRKSIEGVFSAGAPASTAAGSGGGGGGVSGGEVSIASTALATSAATSAAMAKKAREDREKQKAGASEIVSSVEMSHLPFIDLLAEYIAGCNV